MNIQEGQYIYLNKKRDGVIEEQVTDMVNALSKLRSRVGLIRETKQTYSYVLFILTI